MPSTIGHYPQRGCHMAKRLVLLFAVALLAVPLLAAVPSSGMEPGAMETRAPAVTERYEMMPFENGTLLIPMDSMQADRLSVFGMIHALLRNDTQLHRLITPPEQFIRTRNRPAGANYSGGPFLVTEFNETLMDEMRNKFQNVTVDYVSELFISSKVYSVKKATSILLITGMYDWGRTHTAGPHVHTLLQDHHDCRGWPSRDDARL